jgi:hypothetical protein
LSSEFTAHDTAFFSTVQPSYEISDVSTNFSAVSSANFTTLKNTYCATDGTTFQSTYISPVVSTE